MRKFPTYSISLNHTDRYWSRRVNIGEEIDTSVLIDFELITKSFTIYELWYG